MNSFGSRLGHKSNKGAVSLSNYKGRIRLRWRCSGKRYSLSLSFWNELNLLEAQKVALQIEQDLIVGIFDSSLQKYAPSRKIASKPTTNKILSFVEKFELWTKHYKQMDCEIHTNYNSTRNMIRKWGKVSEENILSKLNKENFCAATYNRRLALLRNFVEWLVDQGHWNKNPLSKVSAKKSKMKKLAKQEPFTEIEIRAILEAVRTNRFCSPYANVKHSFYYPFLYFLFKTGVRNAEAIGLRVGSIHLQTKMIHIHEVMARTLSSAAGCSRIRKETKNGKQRMLPLTQDLLNILSPLIAGRDLDDLVFLSPQGSAIDDHNFQRRIFKPVLRSLNIKERTLYAVRHTFGSRCIDQGLTPVMTAFLMGNNPETALRRYTHQINLPEELPKI